jgi:ankyrin repeat protein
MKQTLLILMAVALGCVTNPNVTPLMKAAKSGDADNVQQLIDGGTNIDEESAYGWTALMFASWQGHEEVVRFLLKSGASTDHVSGQVPSRFETTTGHPPTTALAEAIRDEHFEVANILVDHGASPNPAAVTLAAQKGNTVLLEKLLKKGADLNVSNNSEHFSTRSPSLSQSTGIGQAHNPTPKSTFKPGLLYLMRSRSAALSTPVMHKKAQARLLRKSIR